MEIGRNLQNEDTGDADASGRDLIIYHKLLTMDVRLRRFLLVCCDTFRVRFCLGDDSCADFR